MTLTIKGRVVLLALFSFLSASFVAGFSYKGLQGSSGAMTYLTETATPRQKAFTAASADLSLLIEEVFQYLLWLEMKGPAEEADALRQSIDEALQRIDGYAEQGLLSPEKHESFTKKLGTALTMAGRNPRIGFGGLRGSLGDYYELSSDLQAQHETSNQEAENALARAQKAIGSANTVLSTVGAAAILLSLLISIFIGSRISNGVKRMARSMSAVANDEEGLVIPDVGSKDELGEMAKALLVFQESQAAKRELASAEEKRQKALQAQENSERAAAEERTRLLEEQADRERQEREAAREAAAQADMMQADLALVIQSAQAGDFSARMSTPYNDERHEMVRNSVNRLVETVEFGLQETSTVLAAIADRDLTKRMEGRFEGSFAKLMHDVNQGTNTLDQSLASIAESATLVSSNSKELSNAAEHLSKRTEDAAFKLGQANEVMSAIDTVTEETSERSRGASDTAREAFTSAENSGGLVTGAVNAMEEIAEFSDKIGKVTSVINEIAFQTNLLALNAGVEAARAGTSGRGFAVVATEVRSLAQRSAEASREIEELISNSQSKVERGNKLVGQVGDAMGTLVSQIEKVATAVQDIAASSKEQAVRSTKMTEALEEIDRLTQTNAAMGEETLAATATLSDSARFMHELIFRFNTTSIAANGGDEAFAETVAKSAA